MIYPNSHIILFCMALSLTLIIMPAERIFAQENMMMSATKNDDSSGNRLFPPDTDVRLNPDNGTIRYLKVKNPSKKFFGIQPKSENPEDIAISFVEFYKTLFRLQQPHSELKCVAAQTDELGLRHIHFRQIYQEIPVWAKEINVHLDRNNSVYLVEGQYIPTPHYVLTQPAFSASKAVELVFDEIGVKADREPQDIAELVIYAKEFKKALLAYKVQAPGRMVFVDAAKGVIIEHISTRLTNSDKFVPEAPSLR